MDELALSMPPHDEDRALVLETIAHNEAAYASWKSKEQKRAEAEVRQEEERKRDALRTDLRAFAWHIWTRSGHPSRLREDGSLIIPERNRRGDLVWLRSDGSRR